MDRIYDFINNILKGLHNTTVHRILVAQVDILSEYVKLSPVDRVALLRTKPNDEIKKLLVTMSELSILRSDIGEYYYEKLKLSIGSVDSIIKHGADMPEILKHIDHLFIIVSHNIEKAILKEFKTLQYGYVNLKSADRMNKLQALSLTQINQLLIVMQVVPGMQQYLREPDWKTLIKNSETVANLCMAQLVIATSTPKNIDDYSVFKNDALYINMGVIPRTVFVDIDVPLLFMESILKKLTQMFSGPVSIQQMVILAAFVGVPIDDSHFPNYAKMLNNIVRTISSEGFFANEANRHIMYLV